jgi:hypothetical protein
MPGDKSGLRGLPPVSADEPSTSPREHVIETGGRVRFVGGRTTPTDLRTAADKRGDVNPLLGILLSQASIDMIS